MKHQTINKLDNQNYVFNSAVLLMQANNKYLFLFDTFIGTFSYVYSGDCPVIRSEWCVEDLTGNIVLNFTEIQ